MHLMRTMLLTSLLLLTTISATAQFKYDKPADWNLPDTARVRLEKAGTLAHYDLADNLNPFYLRGDFDGDGKPDYAILVISKDTKKRGIAVIKSLTAGVRCSVRVERSSTSVQVRTHICWTTSMDGRMVRRT